MAKRKIARKASLRKGEISNVEVKKKSSVNNAFVPIVAAVIVIAIIVLEMMVSINKEKQMTKKPEIVKYWTGVYKGPWGMMMYGDNFYIADHDQSQMQKYNKMTGELITAYTIGTNIEPIWAAESKAGDTYIITRNSGILYRFAGQKKIAEMKLDGVNNPVNMAINSKDVLYISEGSTAKVIKFDLNGAKHGEFGGIGGGSSQFKQSIGRLFIDSKDNILVIEPSDMMVKVFNSKDQFLRQWKITVQKPFGFEGLATTPDGDVYVNDYNGSQILVYNEQGKQIGKFDRDLTGNFVISYPASICGGNDGYVYVCTHHIAIFKAIKY